MAKILVVDDDPHIRELITLYLRREGFETIEAENGLVALEIAETTTVDLVVLDIMMPQMDGWELCRELRANFDMPLLMVTAKGEAAQRIKGFQLGTDDYLVKPFDPFELILRVKALLRRSKIASSEMLQLGEVIINRKSLEVIIKNKKLTLPLKEFEVLFKLASYPSQIFTRDQLIEQIWGLDYEGDDRTVDVHIKRLRDKLAGETSSFRIVTIRGLGYRLEVSHD